jgi:hypothetical protein
MQRELFFNGSVIFHSAFHCRRFHHGPYTCDRSYSPYRRRWLGAILLSGTEAHQRQSTWPMAAQQGEAGQHWGWAGWSHALRLQERLTISCTEHPKAFGQGLATNVAISLVRMPYCSVYAWLYLGHIDMISCSFAFGGSHELMAGRLEPSVKKGPRTCSTASRRLSSSWPEGL